MSALLQRRSRVSVFLHIAIIRPDKLTGIAETLPTAFASRPARWPALDGLRGTAVLGVLACHYSGLLPQTPAVGALQFGWAGVDLFFVLSGFLITGILFDAKGTTNYFGNFYARRILRIFPLYYGFLVITVLSMLAVKLFTASHGNSDDDHPLHQLWAAQPSLWTYTANYWIALQSKWSHWAEIIVPLWSLSVEEQFYLLWPLVVWRLSHRALMRACLGLICGALLLRLVLAAAGAHWFTLYTLTPTRADSLAAGGLLALILRLPDGLKRARKLSNYAGPLAIVLLLAVSQGFDPIHHPCLRVILYTPLAIFFAALLYWSIDDTSLGGIPARFYRLALLRTIGRYSYGVYIVHLPLMYLITAAATRWRLFDPLHPTWQPGLTLIALNVPITAAVAFASFHLYEKKFLKLKDRFPTPPSTAS